MNNNSPKPKPGYIVIWDPKYKMWKSRKMTKKELESEKAKIK